MNTTTLKTLLRSALVVALLGVLAGTAAAQCTNDGLGTTTCNLVADAFTWGTVPMWGFATDDGQACGAGGDWAVGPLLPVDLAGVSGNLTINLRNCLGEPVSIIVPGLPMPAGAAPIFATDAAGRSRAVSFTSEAAANGGTVSYSWTGVKPGTFLYHSGSNPAKQVQMGLYGGLIVDFHQLNGIAYPDNPDTVAVDPVVYDIDAVLVASEIDPALHNPPVAATPLGFKPKYFLVNGRADGLTALSGPVVNDRVLLRFLNAGSLDYVPTLLGEDMLFVAEDANPYTYPVPSYGELLAAGKTRDALWTPVSDGDHALYDRRLHLSSNGVPGGGLVATINIGTAVVPTADAGPDQQGVAPGTLVTLDGSASGGSGTYTVYDWSLVGFPAGSTAALVPDALDPSIVTFTADVAGAYTAQLVVTDDAGANSTPDSVNVFTDRPPVAIATGTSPVNVGAVATLDGSASYDPDGTAVTYAWTLTVPAGSLAALSNPSIVNPTFTADVAGDYVADLTVTSGLLSGTDTVTVTAITPVNHAPVAVADSSQVTWWTNPNNGPTSVAIDVVANDTDADCSPLYGCINRASVTIVTQPANGTITSVVNGVVTYSPNRGWRGTEYFSYQVCDDGTPTPPVLCSTGAVQVNVIK